MMPHTRDADPGPSPIRTLIVDDDPYARRLHARYLAELDGFRLVGAVGSGEAAGRLIVAARVDLLLLDINLPDFSGIEVLHRLRGEARSNVDVIVISSSRDRMTVRQAASAHIVCYLVKPFSQSAFAQRLGEYRSSHAVAHGRRDEISYGQQEIDRMLQASHRPAEPATAGRRDLPKGMSGTTVEQVRAALSRSTPLTADEIAKACGLSRVTARRYLEHLHAIGAADIAHRYGARGRPALLYRLAPYVDGPQRPDAHPPDHGADPGTRLPD